MNRSLLALPAVLVACGSAPVTHRYVDTEMGYTDALGAAGPVTYTATAEAERDLIRIRVMEQSECDKLRMKVISRVDQAVRGDEVVDSEPAKTMQLPAGTLGKVPCNERYARNVWVALRIGDETYRIGMPSPKGEVVANLAGRLRQGLYAENAPKEATVVVDGKDAGVVSLASYGSHEARVDALLEDFRALLAKDPGTLTPEDITRSYELYEQLGQLDTGGDPRIAAVRTRFVELLFQRKQKDATENLKRNLKALAEAKSILPAVGPGMVPPYMLGAVQGGLLSPEALFWARGEAALAVHRFPALCGAPFTWSEVAAPSYPAPVRLAFSYLHFAYDDPFQTEIRGLCTRGGRW